MSDFTIASLIKHLEELDDAPENIAGVTMWVLSHHSRRSEIVKIWTQALQNASLTKKQTLMNLAHEVIVCDDRVGPGFAQEFASELSMIFSLLGESCRTENQVAFVERILSIWQRYDIYNAEAIRAYHTCFEQALNGGSVLRMKILLPARRDIRKNPGMPEQGDQIEHKKLEPERAQAKKRKICVFEEINIEKKGACGGLDDNAAPNLVEKQRSFAIQINNKLKEAMYTANKLEFLAKVAQDLKECKQELIILQNKLKDLLKSLNLLIIYLKRNANGKRGWRSGTLPSC